MDKKQTAIDIIERALPLVPFEGWNQATLGKAAVAAGYKKSDVICVFPGGAIDAVDMYMHMTDLAMLKTLQSYYLDIMKIRQRIAIAVRLKLEAMEPNREAVRKAIAMHALPFYTHLGLRSLYATVDNIWRAIGDTSTDFNFYTKRLLLGAVYSSSLVYWLDDKSTNHENTWEFIDRRIENVMQIEKAKHRFKNWYTKMTA